MMAFLDYSRKIAAIFRSPVASPGFSRRALLRNVFLVSWLSGSLALAQAQDSAKSSETGRESALNAELVGQTAPDTTFTGADGQKIALASYRGKPVLIDLWATWCIPCLAALPSLNRIFKDFKSKGLTIIGVDQDKIPARATAYLAQHHYNWTNFHDGDRSVEEAMRGYVLPLTVLIDGNGKIVYYDLGSDEAGLRKAIAGLGPDFASVASPARAANLLP